MAPTADLLRRLIRHHARHWLVDPNVTSVGIGHKIVAGRATDQVAVQFTVRAKVTAAELEELGSAPLPEQVEFEHESVVTDVVQRSFVPAYEVVPEAAGSERKQRVDPMRPGVSIAHPSVSAGTAGCIVYDAAEGTALVLSNWHVLHGPDGTIGDAVLQPGPHDDNRTGRNRLGTLTRSHLGVAGDCAVCTVEGRGIDADLLDLDITPDQIADPELGDRVVKSSRTTGVTHGVVNRVDTIVKLDYGTGGDVQVGCFEIAPDPNRDGRLSDGGDSGAAWLHKAGNGRPTRVLAGLHFAGNAAGEPEHALACVPQSVFEKLGVTFDREAARQTAARAASERGYDPDFLARPVAVPQYRDRADLVEVDGDTTIRYTHFSLAQSRSRRFARWVAWNIDGGAIRRISRDGQQFRLDPRVPEEAQCGEDLYRENPIDRGHIARRADLCWGPDAEQANADSFHFTNIAPQMDEFNQSGRDGVWGELENAVFAEVQVDRLRVSVFGGPVFADDDRSYRGVQIPREFWKIICFVADDALRARAFLLTQQLDRLEALALGEFRTYQVEPERLAERTGLTFPAAMRAASGAAAEAVAEPRLLDSVADVVW